VKTIERPILGQLYHPVKERHFLDGNNQLVCPLGEYVDNSPVRFYAYRLDVLTLGTVPFKRLSSRNTEGCARVYLSTLWRISR
jgi:hypothetical protein